MLLQAERPLTAEEIGTIVGAGLPPLDLATIYRNLDVLEQLSLVHHLHPAHGPRHYRLTRREEADYIACEQCGRIDAIATTRLDTARVAIAEATGYQTNFAHFPIV
ncbi:MAG TPA: transcriptional repressor, partial [Candidatus Dormibacteraeota bacterium]|nr:transcriptional repressor [Candidatus Dormibacteraeota bacterium]